MTPPTCKGINTRFAPHTHLKSPIFEATITSMTDQAAQITSDIIRNLDRLLVVTSLLPGTAEGIALSRSELASLREASAVCPDRDLLEQFLDLRVEMAKQVRDFEKAQADQLLVILELSTLIKLQIQTKHGYVGLGEASSNAPPSVTESSAVVQNFKRRFHME
ncbi:hypothetical protein CC1G_13790 [Coprinopsis cinerea okayama7|uniref:Uncharacterized protein n=1 Tax=Coprinopsis cinerea (strain Okayama-7 / 130 / ATCC MYA-4618 / FGSC 9003) TaxID=240176 RepID=D6RK97_COPC7|nr:hypothetical protein CC1G_13790 [Coprinopsis cinerea okayama7\|eukprot:XP_002912258.1 hypothetical protein CC1G_13790 [Coprinopsis cinerea okayama7\